MAPVKNEQIHNIAELLHATKKICYTPTRNGDDISLVDSLYKSVADPEGHSRQGARLGEQYPPFDIDAAIRLGLVSAYHETCILTKGAATTGLGLKDPKKPDNVDKISPDDPAPNNGDDGADGDKTKADEILDPLCGEGSFLELMVPIGMDYFGCGNAFIEVVRDSVGGQIIGLHRQMPGQVIVVVEDKRYNKHFLVRDTEGTGGDRRFPLFGDFEFFDRQPTYRTIDGDTTSELIHLRQPSTISKYFGVPDYLASVSAMELGAKLRQHGYDVFNNRGVPEFLLFLLGGKLPPDDWNALTKALKANIGSGNAFKSTAVNLADPNIKVDMHKLASDAASDLSALTILGESLALEVVTAHRVPPILAGIQVPGKLGATNELPNALAAFQALVISQAQKVIQTRLATTLGNPAVNGGLDLTPRDLRFKKITEELDLASLSTIGGMRQPLPQARAEGRDMRQGMKKESLGRLLKDRLET